MGRALCSEHCAVRAGAEQRAQPLSAEAEAALGSRVEMGG